MSDQPNHSAQPHPLSSAGDDGPATSDATPDSQAVRAAVLGPTSLMPTVERPDARLAGPDGWLRWAAPVVLVAVAITVWVLLTA